jgi:hypothetical protein
MYKRGQATLISTSLQSSNEQKSEIIMPRIPRGDSANGIYHIINRGNMRMQVFSDTEDYEYFLELLHNSEERYKMG